MSGRRADLTSTLRKRFRFWLALNPDVPHLPRLALWGGGLLAVIAGLIWLLYPTGPVIPMSGAVVGLGFQETDQGSIATASVRADRGVYRMRLPTRHQCRIGDAIQLRRRSVRFGEMVAVARVPRPCARPRQGQAPGALEAS